MESNDDYTLIQSAARIVRDLCDGAKTADGKGFDKGHIGFGRVLAHAPLSAWSPGLAARGARVMQRFHRQIPQHIAALQEISSKYLENSEFSVIEAVLGVEDGRPVILSACYGDEEREKRFEKVARGLGFRYDADTGTWPLNDWSSDSLRIDEHIAELELAGWHILPEAKGIFGSMIGRVTASALRKRHELEQKMKKEADAREAQRESRRAMIEAETRKLEALNAQEQLRHRRLNRPPPVGLVEFSRRGSNAYAPRAVWFQLPDSLALLDELRALTLGALEVSADEPGWVVWRTIRLKDISAAREFADKHNLDARNL